MTGQQVRFTTKGGVLRFADGSFRRWACRRRVEGRHPFGTRRRSRQTEDRRRVRLAHRRRLLDVFSWRGRLSCILARRSVSRTCIAASVADSVNRCTVLDFNLGIGSRSSQKRG